MSNKVYKYKQLACSIPTDRTKCKDGQKVMQIKAWSRPVTLIRKVGDLTCEGCFFDRVVNGVDICHEMLMSKQLPSCAPSTKRMYIFKKVVQVNSQFILYDYYKTHNKKNKA